ncbi:LPS export ABC transporter periplasmic protein LptC [Nitrospinae bacterium AH_259_B05_G02_I21]|nr:LPS export ABC transporter periplasmic protein LptC [Nitrospinae bacterium AH_259_B05_G02_I21]
MTTYVVRSRRAASPPPQKAPPAISKADLTIQTIHLVENRGGHTEWELDARTSESFRKEKITVLKDVKVKFYPVGHPVVHVSGREGRLKTDTKDMTINGDVVIQSEAGYTLKTQKLRYDAGKRRVYTELPVELRREGIVIEGVGLSASIDGKTLTVHHDVKAMFR